MNYLEFDGGDYTQLRKELLEHKGSELQKGLLEATKDRESFIQWIEKRVDLEDEGKKFDLWSDKLSEAEYKRAPGSVEKQLFKTWKGLTPAQASRETFWGYVTIGHIKQGIIESSYLAANNNPSLSGLGRIDQALKSNQEKPIDDVVRTILRNLGGLPGPRGSRSVYVDCPFARAWWRTYFAYQFERQICDETGTTDFNKIFATLRGTSKAKNYWETLIDLIVSQYSQLGDTKVISALIWALSERKEVDPTTLGRISKQIGTQLALRELGVFTVGELKEQVMEPTILRVLESKPNRFKRFLGRS